MADTRAAASRTGRERITGEDGMSGLYTIAWV